MTRTLLSALTAAALLIGTPAYAADGDGDGWDESIDCDDSDATINPGAVDCDDGVDNDCDDNVDEVGVAQGTWYTDADNDGYGDPSAGVDACEIPSSLHITDGTDCDDGDASVNPGADELCDGLDNDCDGFDDEDAVDESTWYADADGDGYGDYASSAQACDQPSGYVDNDMDCHDGDATIYVDAPELCDGLDNDCDGFDDEGLLGAEAACAAESCAALLDEEPSTPSGDYYIDDGSGGALMGCDMDTDGGGWTQVIAWDGSQSTQDKTTLAAIFETDINDMGVWADGNGYVSWCDNDFSHDALSLSAPIDVVNDGEVMVDVQLEGISMEGSGVFISVDDGSAEHNVVCSDDIRRNAYSASALSWIPSDYSCANSDTNFSWDGVYTVDAQADVLSLRLSSLMKDQSCLDEGQLHGIEVWVR